MVGISPADLLCHSSAICPNAFGLLLGAMALKWGPFLKEALGLHVAQLRTCLRAPGEELLPKAILHFHSQTPSSAQDCQSSSESIQKRGEIWVTFPFRLSVV